MFNTGLSDSLLRKIWRAVTHLQRSRRQDLGFEAAYSGVDGFGHVEVGDDGDEDGDEDEDEEMLWGEGRWRGFGA